MGAETLPTRVFIPAERGLNFVHVHRRFDCRIAADQ